MAVTGTRSKIEHALEMIECNQKCTVEWTYLNKVYKQLSQKASTDRGLSASEQELMKLIEPTMHKYGYYRVSSNDSSTKESE